jgi:hypothetical protein
MRGEGRKLIDRMLPQLSAAGDEVNPSQAGCHYQPEGNKEQHCGNGQSCFVV